MYICTYVHISLVVILPVLQDGFVGKLGMNKIHAKSHDLSSNSPLKSLFGGIPIEIPQWLSITSFGASQNVWIETIETTSSGLDSWCFLFLINIHIFLNPTICQTFCLIMIIAFVFGILHHEKPTTTASYSLALMFHIPCWLYHCYTFSSNPIHLWNI